ncbi:MAG: hypothetical protein ABSA75_05730 [Candidatus Bathyarchaeia archaeon]|jgi:hypothetical protein
MSDNYGSLEWYRQLSDTDKAFASTYGRSALIQKQKREAEFQQQQEQQQVEEPQVEEQVEESEEESEPQIDPLLEEKKELLEQKKRIMDKLENEIDEKHVTDEILAEYLAVPAWREIFLDYIRATGMLLDGYADYFLHTSIRKGDVIDREFEFYKNNKLVTVDTTFSTSEGTKTVAEIIAQQEKKREEYMKKVRHSGIASVESNQKAEDD